MKKGTAIKEDNKARQFAAVQKVVINKTSSGTSLWVPEDIAETDELSVTENGVYCAYDDNVFGYSQVVVNVSESLNDRSEKEKAISKITGTNPDTGDTESYGVDENGNLTKDVFPSGLPQAIHIVIAPTKRTYNEGDSLDFTGIHVYLLDGEGHQWTSDEYPTGEIPFDELIFPVTVVEGGSGTSGKATYDGFTVNYCNPSDMYMKFGLTEESIERNTYGFANVSGSGVLYGVIRGSYVSPGESDEIGLTMMIFSDESFSGTYRGYNGSIENIPTASHETTDHGVDFYASYVAGSWTTHYTNESHFPAVTVLDVINNYTIADALFLGEHESGDVEIPVQWMRSDGETLEDNFTITISSGGTSGSSGSSSSGGGHSGGDF